VQTEVCHPDGRTDERWNSGCPRQSAAISLARRIRNARNADENLVSHHLRALRTAGLGDYRRDGKMALYSLTEHGRVLLDTLRAEISA
jgi:DNA-binding transcriptional ArsR family regulator